MARATLIWGTVAWVWGALLLGCGGDGKRPEPGRPAPAEDFSADEGTSDAPASDGKPKPAGKSDGPHISRSIGEEGGVIVFWPRVIPRTDDASINTMASSLQKELAAIAKETFAGKAVDVRPEPERVCPRDGCAAMTVGAVLTHVGGGCSVIALVSEPGKSPQRIVPWAGLVELKREIVPFREPAESEVTIKDAVPCGELIKKLGDKKADIVAAMKKAAE